MDVLNNNKYKLLFSEKKRIIELQIIKELQVIRTTNY